MHPIKVLYAEDDPRDVVLIREVLGDSALVRFSITHVKRLADIRAQLLSRSFDVVLTDLGLPDSNGLETYRQVRACAAVMPIVVLTGMDDEAMGLTALREGAQDYLVKGPLSERSLVRVLCYAIEKKGIEEQLRGKNIEIATANQALLAEVTMRRQAEEQLRALTHRVVQAQEAERGRVALELHDQITQLLCAILIRSQALADSLTASNLPAKTEAIELRKLLGETAGEVERISQNLRPSILEHLGLTAVLRVTSNEFAKRTRVPVKLASVELPGRLPADAELALFRILQEALGNVEKHARAHHVSVNLTKQGNYVELVVKDDGIGFDPDHRRTGPEGRLSFGLLSMRERATFAGGALSIKSAPGAGAEIKARIPLLTITQ